MSKILKLSDIKNLGDIDITCQESFFRLKQRLKVRNPVEYIVYLDTLPKWSYPDQIRYAEEIEVNNSEVKLLDSDLTGEYSYVPLANSGFFINAHLRSSNVYREVVETLEECEKRKALVAKLKEAHETYLIRENSLKVKKSQLKKLNAKLGKLEAKLFEYHTTRDVVASLKPNEEVTKIFIESKLGAINARIQKQESAIEKCKAEIEETNRK